MSLMLRNLDDRRWADLVNEARALIPVHAPEWTDHNIHDPGITFIELLAWIVEADIYRINRIPDSHRLRFLELVGVQPEPPRPAAAVVAARLVPGSPPTFLPAGTELTAEGPEGDPVAFRTLEPVTALAGRLAAVLRAEGNRLVDLTDMWQRGETIRPFGVDPRPGAAFYLGFELRGGSLADLPLAVAFLLADAREDERTRLIDAEREGEEACRPELPNPCADEPEPPAAPSEGGGNSKVPRLRHHDVLLAWEVFIGGDWHALTDAHAVDNTRAFTLDGRILLTLPPGLAPDTLPEVDQALLYIRCRLLAGVYDKAPEIRAFDLNGVEIEQAHRVGALFWKIDPDANITGPTPVKGTTVRLDFTFNEAGAVNWLQIGGEGAPAFFVLDYAAPANSARGKLGVAAERFGSGTGLPGQRYALSTPAVAGDILTLVTAEADGIVQWRPQSDFLASGRADAAVVVDAANGLVTFGDGERGRAPPKGAPILAAYQATLAALGNLATRPELSVVGGSVNKALMVDVETVQSRVEQFRWLTAPAGGTAAETVDDAAGRTLNLLERRDRAVTLADYETLAMKTPGTRIARAIARANTHPAFPCLKAPGVITLIVVPFLPVGRPSPSLALRRRVSAYLAGRRLIGTRFVVAGPVYVEVVVEAKVRACPRVSREALLGRIRSALDAFFDPLVGGPEAEGWRLGRDVYRAEVFQVIDGTDGVDHVFALVLYDESGTASCGNFCVPPNGLAASGAHRIEVV